ncbi:hypothetical protein BGC07_06995 [Piscirickettsia litoralis]|uniref:Major facilitator superfamily (MFS) profile domain-containing protein n=1 Tax=Piscirickettsia litoralis TaxID=1891921 RepID=A0ABX3A4Z3_9GAMM|nr:hypothetical protein BGC07_06995 [Piscirickettsia litoralis]
MFFSFSPYLLIDRLGIAKTEFGYWFGLNALALMVTSFIGGFGVKYLSIRFWMGLGSLCMLVGGLMMTAWLYYSGLSLAAVMVPMLIISAGIAWTVSPSVAGAMTPFGHVAGSAAALLGCIRFGGASIVVTLMVTLGSMSALYFASCVCILSLVTLISFIFIIKRRHTVVY